MKIYSRVLDGYLAGFYFKDIKGAITSYQVNVSLGSYTTVELEVFFESFINTKDIVKTEGVTEAYLPVNSGEGDIMHTVYVVFPCPDNLVGLSGYVSAGVDSEVVSSVEEI